MVAGQGSHFKIGFVVAAVHVLPAITLGQYLSLWRRTLGVVLGLLEEIVVTRDSVQLVTAVHKLVHLLLFYLNFKSEI